MRFEIGPFTYRVRIAEALIIFDGKPRRGLAVQSDREILIGPDIPLNTREEVLMHEIMHLWLFHCGRPVETEDICNSQATITGRFNKDYAAGGGLNALLMMKPSDPNLNPVEETPMPVENDPEVETIRRVPVGIDRADMPLPRGDRAYCCVCGGVVNGGSVVVSESRWDLRTRGRVRDMQFFCPACDCVQTVTLGTTLNNDPDGQALVGRPLVERGRVADDFLISHPGATGEIIG